METHDVFLHSFVPVFPRYHLNQQELVDWTILAHQKASEFLGAHDAEKIGKLKKYCLSNESIQERWYECDDVNTRWDQHDIYALSERSPAGKDIEVRNDFFDKRAEEIFSELYETSQTPDHLIHVTCTGYISPSPPQKFFSSKEVRPEITHAYHMGCYASLPSVRMGEGLVKGRSLNVDIVHTEMCSLHMNPLLHTPEQILVQSLFADGHIRYSLTPENPGLALKLLSTCEEIVPDSAGDMTWVPGPMGMKMTLSKDVPMKIAGVLGSFLKKLAESAGKNPEELLKKAIFAVHPGGPKIITGVQELLGLSDEQVKFSHEVLLERGNMSSATLPHVWKKIMDSRPTRGTPVVSLAFGPGLTVFGGLFEVN